MSRGSPSDSFSERVTAEPPDIASVVALALSVRRAERETTCRDERSSVVASAVEPAASVVASADGLGVAVATSAAAGVSTSGSLAARPPVTLTPVTAAASPVRTTPVRRARRGARTALCLPGTRCFGTYLSDFGTGAHGG